MPWLLSHGHVVMLRTPHTGAGQTVTMAAWAVGHTCRVVEPGDTAQRKNGDVQ